VKEVTTNEEKLKT